MMVRQTRSASSYSSSAFVCSSSARPSLSARTARSMTACVLPITLITKKVGTQKRVAASGHSASVKATRVAEDMPSPITVLKYSSETIRRLTAVGTYGKVLKKRSHGWPGCAMKRGEKAQG